MRFDPVLAHVMAAMPAQPDTTAVPDDEYGAVRDAAHRYFELNGSMPDPEVAQTDVVVPKSGLPVRIYRPADENGVLPAIVWIHGGGFTVGMIDADDFRCRRYVTNAQCVVVSAEYRLAPEHPFPAGINDAWDALQWTFDNAAELQIDSARIAIGGCSAGGNFAAALAQRARDEGGPPLVFQLLVYPVLDDRLETLSSREKIDSPIWTRSAGEASWRRYLRLHEGEIPALAAPARAVDLSGLPPAFVLTAEHDPLRDEGNEYAIRMQHAGVPTELHQYAGSFHGFEAIGIDAPIVRRALDEQCRALREALHTPLVSRQVLSP